MNGFLILGGICIALAVYEFFIAIVSFFRKKPNWGMGIGALAAGFMSGLLGIWVSTFDLAVADVLIAFVITMIVMLMVMCIRQASKEQQ